jgi:hypothetical protein
MSHRFDIATGVDIQTIWRDLAKRTSSATS